VRVLSELELRRVQLERCVWALERERERERREPGSPNSLFKRER